jgi:oligopeptide transport system permease protein
MNQRQALRHLFSSCTHRLGCLVLLAVVLSCVVGPMLLADGPNDQDLALRASGPSARHWLGTDALGRDLLARVLVGGRISLLVGLLATAVASVIGVAYGMVAGLAGRRVDAIMMRVVDVLYAFPFMTFVILLVVVFGRRFELIFVAIGAVEWLTMARVVRTQVMVLRDLDFVNAARCLGAGRWRILVRHLLPNIAGTAVVYASLTVPGVMMLEATLSFLGLGIQPPDASWGVLISEGADQMAVNPWQLASAGAAFILTLWSLGQVGDALREYFDPRQAR